MGQLANVLIIKSLNSIFYFSFIHIQHPTHTLRSISCHVCYVWIVKNVNPNKPGGPTITNNNLINDMLKDNNNNNLKHFLFEKIKTINSNWVNCGREHVACVILQFY